MRALITIVFAFLLHSCQPAGEVSRSSLRQIPKDYTGSFIDDYGIAYSITTKEWRQGINTKYHLLYYNKSGNYLLAKNDFANPSDGGLYTRIDLLKFETMPPWTWGFCLTSYKAQSFGEAKASMANRSDPRKGCNGYPFSRMQRK